MVLGGMGFSLGSGAGVERGGLVRDGGDVFKSRLIDLVSGNPVSKRNSCPLLIKELGFRSGNSSDV